MASDDNTNNPSRGADLSAAEIELKRRGRRRLIGAVTLGLVALVVLPMVFDSEPKQSASADRLAGKLPKQEIAIQIPPKEGLTALPPPVVPPVGDAPTEAPQVASTVPTANPVQESGKSPASVASAAPAPIAPAKKATDAPKPDPVPVKDTSGPAAKSSAASAPAAEKFAVQIGVYRDADNAKSIIAKVTDAGLPVVTESIAVAAGKVTRVRVGPYPTRPAAEAALAQIKLAGIDGKIVPVGK